MRGNFRRDILRSPFGARLTTVIREALPPPPPPSRRASSGFCAAPWRCPHDERDLLPEGRQGRKRPRRPLFPREGGLTTFVDRGILWAENRGGGAR
jgi:hypothetical protein